MKYFAYGSNMSLDRMHLRVPSAAQIGAFCLEGYELKFHKVGQDGSGKCDALFTGNTKHHVFGVLYEICSSDKLSLDQAEDLGIGYAEKMVTVENSAGQEVQAFTYTALIIKAGLMPFSWYKEHVIIGANEAQLPKGYQATIATVETLADPNIERSLAQSSIHEGVPVDDVSTNTGA